MAAGKSDKPQHPEPPMSFPPGLLKPHGPRFLEFLTDLGGRASVDADSVVLFQESREGTITLFLDGGHVVSVSMTYDDVRALFIDPAEPAVD
jgi:hypothetical protein